MKLFGIILFLLIVLGAVFAISLIDFFPKEIDPPKIINIQEKIDVKYSDYDKCNNLGLEQTVKCVHDLTMNFYKYNKNNDIYKDFETLKEQGGDCFNYAKFYQNEFTKRDLIARTKIITTKAPSTHMFLIVHNHEGYCIVDLTKYYCSKLY